MLYKKKMLWRYIMKENLEKLMSKFQTLLSLNRLQPMLLLLIPKNAAAWRRLGSSDSGR